MGNYKQGCQRLPTLHSTVWTHSIPELDLVGAISAPSPTERCVIAPGSSSLTTLAPSNFFLRLNSCDSRYLKTWEHLMGSSTEKPDGARGQNCGLTFPLTLKFEGEGKVLKRGELASIHPGGLECHPGPNLPPEMLTHRLCQMCFSHTIRPVHMLV